MEVKPIRDRLIVKPIEAETTTASGIVIPNSAKENEKSLKGKVLGVGGGRITDNGTLIPMVVQEGNTVLFGQYAGNGVKINGEEHLVLKEDEVMAILD
jgi:chaperonin GroES